MKIAAICSTYKRPTLLAEAIECFLRQDYPSHLRELVVLDDAGQYCSHTGPGYRVVSVPSRFRSLGEKRNATAALASPDADAYCVWDDDDIYLPWHISAAAAALRDADYCIPSVIYNGGPAGVRAYRNHAGHLAAGAFRRAAFDAVSGYPFIQSGEDQALLARFRQQRLVLADPIAHEPRPSFIYRWHTAHRNHVSALGPDGYAKLGAMESRYVGLIKPGWEVDWVALRNAAPAGFPESPGEGGETRMPGG